MSGDTQKRRLDDLSPAQRALLEQRLLERRTAAARKNAIRPRDVRSPCELSYAQELLWLLSQVFDDGIAYNAPSAFQLEGPLDLELLEKAFQGLAGRHEILRTTYTVIDGVPMQVIGERAPIELNVVDLRQWPADTRDAEAQRVLKEESRFAFDLVNGPVLRPTVIRLTDNEHILQLVLHHVATDGWSRGVLYRDLTTLYEAAAEGVPAALAPLPIQYADYAVWQRHWLDGGVADAQLDYWKQRLHRAPSRLELPTDYPRPPVRSYLGEQVSMMLDMDTREGLRAAARGQDATLFVALLSVFASLLQRYAGQDDIVIGTPFAGRNRSELESMVGYFINPLALRVDLSGDPSFSQLLTRARDTVLEAFAHADVPYETVVRATNPERDLSQTPVFQAMIVLHNPAWQTQRPKFEPAGIRSTEISHEKGWSKFDVLVGMSERSTGLNTTWEYSTELFKRSTLERMMEHFRTLAASAALSPDRPMSRLSMLSETERAKLLVGWNTPRQPLPTGSGETIKDLIEAQVKRTPENTAVVFGDGRLTFDELNRRANRIAALLRAHGVGPGTLVGVLMEKSLDLVPAVLGVMKSGGAYIPLDPMYPPDRIEFMVSDAKPPVLLTFERHLETLPAGASDTALALDAPGILDGLPESDPPTTAGGDDLAYIIYTSGSTGLPKGAMIANRSLVSAHHAYARAYRLHELTAHLQMASFSFDVFTGDLIRSLPCGSKMVLCPIEVVVDPPALHEVIVREQVDAAEFVPATASLLFEHLERVGKTLDMRLVVVSSEAWRNEKYHYFKGLCGPNTRLVNAYGLTEATIDSTWFEPGLDAELVPGRFVPIGAPLDNTKIYVLDSQLEPRPIGVAGELCVGGVAVAQGYLNRPELNAEKFVPDPFSDEPGALLYRTGDLARWLEDGTIDFLGRTDRQLKIRGFRIEPGEIEAALESHESVRAAAVTVREDEGGSARLVAYLTPVDMDEPPHFDELRALVADRLPAYMIPAAWVLIDPIPLTPNGKVDVDALPDPEFDRSATTGEFVAPRTDTERKLAEVWSEVLGVEQVGVTDNFFELGGHSLLAVRLFAQIERAIGVKLPLASLFQSATIAEMAEAVDGDSGDAGDWPSIVELKPGDEQEPFFIIGWVDGELLGYHHLAQHWSGRPLLGLLAPGTDGKTMPIDTVEGIAAFYVEQIRRYQPQGPYYFGGFCFAGLVAFEMGRQLVEQGQEIGMVGLIDSYWFGSRRKPTRAEIEREKWAAFWETDWAGRAQWVRNRAIGLRNRIRTEWYFRSGYMALSVFGRLRRRKVSSQRWDLVNVAGARAGKNYKPTPADIHVDYFRAQTAPSDEPTVWDDFAMRGVALRAIVGPEMSHVTILKEPAVRKLAAEMGRLLAAPAAPANGHGPSVNGHGSMNGASANGTSGAAHAAPADDEQATQAA